MSEGFEKLKSIGAQKIHEATYISRAHVQAILNENFEEMHSVQLAGFISILEREYGVDLSDLKNKSKSYYNQSEATAKKENPIKVLGTYNKKRDLTLIYMAVGVVIFILFAIFTFSSSDSEPQKVDNTLIESAQNNISAAQSEQNISVPDENSTINEAVPNEAEVLEKNATAAKAAVLAPKAEAAVATPPSFKIIPNYEVWLGYIDLSTEKRYQKVSAKEFDLDPSKEWLLLFGHGLVSVEVNGVIKKFTTREKIRFLYKNSELKEISEEEFKSLNKGKGW